MKTIGLDRRMSGSHRSNTTASSTKASRPNSRAAFAKCCWFGDICRGRGASRQRPCWQRIGGRDDVEPRRAWSVAGADFVVICTTPCTKSADHMQAAPAFHSPHRRPTPERVKADGLSRVGVARALRWRRILQGTLDSQVWLDRRHPKTLGRAGDRCIA